MYKNALSRVSSLVKETVHESFSIYLPLLKILIPAIIIVKVLQHFGVVDFASDLLAPLMSFVGLPAVFSIVWATTLFTNIITGMVVFFNLAATESLTIAQTTTLGALLLISHSIPVEGAIAKRAGVAWWITILLRVGGAFLFAWLLHHFYSLSGTLQQQAELVWQPPHVNEQLSDWVVGQVKMVASVYFIIVGLVALLKLIRVIGVEFLLHKIIQPVLILIGVQKNAANSVVVGVTLGLTFGAGLLIREIDSGKLETRDILPVMCFLSLCHGLIDDTIVVMLFGAHLSGILFARIVFSVVIVAIFTRLYRPATVV